MIAFYLSENQWQLNNYDRFSIAYYCKGYLCIIPTNKGISSCLSFNYPHSLTTLHNSLLS